MHFWPLPFASSVFSVELWSLSERDFHHLIELMAAIHTWTAGEDWRELGRQDIRILGLVSASSHYDCYLMNPFCDNSIRRYARAVNSLVYHEKGSLETTGICVYLMFAVSSSSFNPAPQWIHRNGRIKWTLQKASELILFLNRIFCAGSRLSHLLQCISSCVPANKIWQLFRIDMNESGLKSICKGGAKKEGKWSQIFLLPPISHKTTSPWQEQTGTHHASLLSELEGSDETCRCNLIFIQQVCMECQRGMGRKQIPFLSSNTLQASWGT